METSPLEHIVKELVADDLLRFREKLDKALEPQRVYLSETEIEIFSRGKKLRPVMMFLAARMVFGDEPLPEKVIKGAASLEMLHVATLIHDDIIDDAGLRRGLPSVNATRGADKALLVGDLHFVQALRHFVYAIETDRDMDLVKMVLDTAFDICRGELDELDMVYTSDEEVMVAHYMTTIERKTAVLFGLACEAGIALVGGRTHQARRGGFYGRHMGRAFQIVDDVLDIVQQQDGAGKTPGIDLLQGRWTLPIIYAVQELGEGHCLSKVMIEFRKMAPDEFQKNFLELKKTNAIDRSYALACEIALDSLFYLEPFSPNPYRVALWDLALYVVDRPIGRKLVDV